MKVLWLTLESNKQSLPGFAESLQQSCELSCHWLTQRAAKHVAKAVGGSTIKAFDRVLLHLPLPLLVKQIPYIRCIPNLVLLQLDLADMLAGQDGCLEKFDRLLNLIPWARVLVPHGKALDFLRDYPVAAASVPLGFNGEWFVDQGRVRAVPAAIVADLDDPPDKKRRRHLFEIKTQNKLQIYDPEEGLALAEQLNQMGIVVCNDEFCGGYRGLNAKVLACGAALMTWDRGEQENQANGFVDMENVILYRDSKSAHARLNFLKRHGDELERIRQAGKALADAEHSDRALAEKVAGQLALELPPFAGDDIEDALRYRFFR